MAPNSNKGVFKPKTEREIPTRFRCKVGGEWKPLDAFSGNQQKLIRWNTGKIDAARSGMTCIDHTSKTRTEARCELCNLIKPRDQFSKNALKNSEFVCMRCTAWTETQEPDVIPAPLETGHISAEEANADVWETGFVDSNDFFDDGLPQAPISDLAALGLADLDPYGTADGPANKILSEILNQQSKTTQSKSDAMSVSGESVTSSKMLPPHLASRMPASMASSKAASRASSVAEDSRAVGNLPPHLQTHREHLDSGSVSTATTVRKEREETKASRQIPFNAWDSGGKRHHGIKNPTTASIMSSSASTSSASNPSANDDENVVGDWSSVPIEMDIPVTRGKGKWVKSSETRIPQSELKKQPILTHTSARHINPDVDRQRRMNYCDSDDSDY